MYIITPQINFSTQDINAYIITQDIHDCISSLITNDTLRPPARSLHTYTYAYIHMHMRTATTQGDSHSAANILEALRAIHANTERESPTKLPPNLTIDLDTFVSHFFSPRVCI